MTEESNDLFVVVPWPEVQDLLEEPDFEFNSCLITDEFMMEEYGNSAYFVRLNYLK
jgi:hypothetical protein